MRDYTLTINVTVTDPQALYEAALVRWHDPSRYRRAMIVYFQ